MRPLPRVLAVALLLAVGAALALHTAWRKSLTADEPKHVVTGAYQLLEGRCCLGWDNGATLAWNAVPLLLGPHRGRRYIALSTNPWASGRLWFLAQPDLDRAVFEARVPSVALWLALGVLVFAWSRSLYGYGGGLLSVVLFAFSPNLLAHGSLATTDVHAAFFMTLACFTWARYHDRPGGLRLVMAGVALGLALAAKFSALALLPSFALLALAAARHGPEPPARAALRGMARTATAAALAAVVVWVAYGAVVTSRPLNAPGTTVPFFPDYAFGLRALARLGERGWDAYFLGTYGRGGWWAYFPVTFAAKTPLPALAAFVVAVAAAPLLEGANRRREAFVWLPALVLTAWALQSHLNIGLRHLLPVYPLLHVFAGRLSRVRWRASPAWRAAMAAGAVWYVGGTLAHHPHHLAYFNEAVGGTRAGWRISVDSDLDWGQDLKELARYLEREGSPPLRLSYFGPTPPGRYGIRYQPLPSYDAHPEDPVYTGEFGTRELVAVSAFNLMGVHPGLRDAFTWLRDRDTVARPGGSIFVYDITGDVEAHERVADLYERTGPEELAALERRRLASLRP